MERRALAFLHGTVSLYIFPRCGRRFWSLWNNILGNILLLFKASSCIKIIVFLIRPSWNYFCERSNTFFLKAIKCIYCAGKIIHFTSRKNWSGLQFHNVKLIPACSPPKLNRFQDVWHLLVLVRSKLSTLCSHVLKLDVCKHLKMEPWNRAQFCQVRENREKESKLDFHFWLLFWNKDNEKELNLYEVPLETMNLS